MQGQPDRVKSTETVSETRTATPVEVFEQYKKRHPKRRASTLQSQRSAWGQFTQWFHQQDNLNHLCDLSEWFATDFQHWLRSHDEFDQKELSLRMTLQRVKGVIDFARARGYVPKGVPSDWDMPTVENEEAKIRSDPLVPERGVEIMDYLERERRFEREHILWVLVFRLGLRNSAVRAIDLEHVELSPDGDHPPYIDLRDRPTLGQSDRPDLPLKNTRSEYNERLIPLNTCSAEVLRGYIWKHRKRHGPPEGDEQNGLITTERSPRISKRCISNRINSLTSPVEYEGDCDCSGCQEYLRDEGRYPRPSDRESICEESRSPHQCRHGAITHMLNKGWSHDDVAHMVGTSPQTIRDVYDRGDEFDRLHRVAQVWQN